MGRYVNPGNSAYATALGSKIYVDKTGLIAYTNSVLGTMDGYICNSRPRRFGKSYAANMLSAYYSKGCDSRELFRGLAISRDASYETQLNKYDVIHIDMQWFLANSQHGAVVRIIADSVLAELCELYPNIDTPHSLSDALSLASERYGARFIIIIDEWDAPIRDERVSADIQEEYINFLRGLFKGVEPTKYIALAYLTGILPIKKETTQSALNNLDEFTMLHAYDLAPYVGFTQDEVRGLCDEYGRDFDKVKKWYDGYLLDGLQIYNPKAIVSIMQKGVYTSYWSQTGSYEAIVPLIGMDFDGLRYDIIQMLASTKIKANVTSFKNDPAKITSKDDVLTYLVHLGYLAYDEMEGAVYIPNEEVAGELAIAVEDSHWDEMLVLQMQSRQLLEATIAQDGSMVAEVIERIHREYASVIRYHDENALASTVAIAYLWAMKYYFRPIREMPAGEGYADMVYVPKPENRRTHPALVIELKWNQSARSALEQIKNRKYPETLLDYTGDLLLVGINYDRASKKHECIIEKYAKI